MPLHPEMGIEDFLDVVIRRKWFILLVFVGVFGAAGAYYVLAPKQYKSSTTILVIPRRVPENYVQSTVSINVTDRLSTMKQQILSRTRLMAVVNELGLYPEMEKGSSPEALVQIMQKDIDITVTRSPGRNSTTTEAFSISFVYTNPRLAMEATSRLASFFIDENLRSREQQAIGTSEFLESQLQETKKKLVEQEEKVKRYKMTFMGELPQQMEANLNRLTRLQDQLRINSDALRAAEDRKIFLEAQIGLFERTASQAVDPGQTTGVASTETRAPLNPLQALLTELNTKKARLATLTARYTDLYPEIIQLRREIEQIETRLTAAQAAPSAQETGASLDNVSVPAIPYRPLAMQSTRTIEEMQRIKAQVISTDAEMVSLKKAGGEIRASIASIQAKVDNSPRREQEMIGLTRDYENLKSKYNDLLNKKLGADISQNLEKHEKGEQFQVIDPPNLPTTPISPNLVFVLGIAFAVAGAGGFGGAFGMEMLNPALRGPGDFKKIFKIPILASIPLRPLEVDRKRIGFFRGKKNERPAGGHPFFRTLKTDPYGLNQFLPLLARIEHKLEANDCKVIAVTSAVPEEGKTASCTGLAVSIANTGKRRVMLVDVDIHKPDIANGFGISTAPGLTDYLTGIVKLDDIIRNSRIPGLYIVPSGSKVEMPAGLLAKEKFRRFLDEIRADYDVILLDTPPVLAVDDTLSLRNLVDGFVLVYRVEATPYKLLAKAIEEIEEKNVLGVVLNGVDMSKSLYYKKYYKKYNKNYNRPESA